MKRPNRVTKLNFDEVTERRNHLLETGELIEATDVAKKLGIKCKVAVTNAFFEHFYPYAEDATKNVTFEEIMEDVMKIFKKNFGNDEQVRELAEFSVMSKTYVKHATNYDQVQTFSDGKPRDKRIDVMVTWMPDERKNPSMVFGVKEAQTFGDPN